MVERQTTWREKRAHDDVHSTVATIPALPIRARMSADNARQFNAVIRGGDAELAATFKMLITLPFLFARPLQIGRLHALRGRQWSGARSIPPAVGSPRSARPSRLCRNRVLTMLTGSIW